LQLGPVGIWSIQFRTGDRHQASDAISELEELGFSTLWIPESGTTAILKVAAELLAASTRIVIASGILNIWMHQPEEVLSAVRGFDAEHPERFLLGLGVSHASLVERTGRAYARPRSLMIDFLDALDAATPPLEPSKRILAALGPKMLELARDRSLGAHPYCVPVEHTAAARETLGAGPVLAPELKAVLVEDPTAARELARAHLEHYLEMPNYTNNLRRFGYSDDDFADGGADRLVDALVAWGSPEVVAARVKEHQAAGADHVCINVIPADTSKFPIDEWRAIADALH
jgi:probable F420-dependent oxidoreductase